MREIATLRAMAMLIVTHTKCRREVKKDQTAGFEDTSVEPSSKKSVSMTVFIKLMKTGCSPPVFQCMRVTYQ